MSNSDVKLTRSIGLFSLVMINIIAINSIRTVPFASHFGQELIGYFILATVLFFLPLGLLCAHLATRFPNRGGVYIWVRQGLGNQWGFLMIWLQWIFNVVWFPSALVFIAATGLAWLNPALLDHQLLLMGTVVGLFTVATFINWRGMEVSSLFTNFCATIGTMLPLVGLILLGYAWMHQHHVASIDWSKPIMPSLGHLDNISYLVAVLFGLIGIEMSATHAEETLNPKRNFPRAIFISILAIVLSLVLASLAMNAILSDQVLDDVTGVIQSFHLLADKMHLQYLEGFMAITIVIGSIGQIAAWIIGPSKGLLVACGDGALPPVWSKQNRHGVPTTILLAQLGIVAVMSVLILLFPDIKNQLLYFNHHDHATGAGWLYYFRRSGT